jgi:hypothetical protein
MRRQVVVSRMIPEGYTGEKETQASANNENKWHCHPQEDLQGGQKDKVYQMFKKQHTPGASTENPQKALRLCVMKL